MNNIIFVGDIHLAPECQTRNDNYSETLFNKLDQVISYANRLKATLIFLGDILHSPKIPHSLLHQFLLKLFFDYGKDWYFIVGNHDVNSNVKDWLEPNELISWIKYWPGANHLDDDEIINIGGHNVGGADYGKPIDHLNGVDIAVTHADYDVYAREVASGSGVKRILNTYPKLNCSIHANGHIHAPAQNICKQGNTYHVNPGALMRRVRDGEDDKRKPCVILYNEKIGPKILPIEHTLNPFKEKALSIKDKEWFAEFSQKLSQEQLSNTEDSMIEQVKADLKSGAITEPIAECAINSINNV